MASMTTQTDPAAGAAARGELPAWLYPATHRGRCYDQIGAISVGAGAAASPLLAAVCTAAQHLLAGHWPLTWADFAPEPVTAAAALALTPLAAAGYFLYRHWLPHRALARVDADNEALLAEAIAAARAGDLDPAQLHDLAPLAAAADAQEYASCRVDGFDAGDEHGTRHDTKHGAAASLPEGALAA
jgi:hypothetical protein